MASTIRFKFRAEMQADSVAFDGHYISIGELKRLIAAKRSMGPDGVNELVLSDPQTQTVYSDDNEQLPKGSAVLVRRLAPQRHRVLVAPSAVPSSGVAKAAAVAAAPAIPAATVTAAASNAVPAATASTGPDASSVDEFGADPFAAQQAALQRELAQATARAQAETAAQLQQQQASRAGPFGGRGGTGPGRGFGRGRGRGPPPDYLCQRCGQPGHWLSDCPTQGDPAFDVKRVRPPAGIPASKLQRASDGSLILPTGEFGQLATNSRAFQEQLALMSGGQVQPQLQNTEMSALPAPEPVPSNVNASAVQELQPEQQATTVQQEPSVQQAAASVAPAAGSEKPPSLFDDEEDPAITQPVKLTSSTGHAADQQVRPSSSVAPVDTEAARLQIEREQLPEDVRRLRCTPKEFMEFLPILFDLLPRADIKILLQAFGSGSVLTPSEFDELKSKYSKQVPSREKDRGHTTSTYRSKRSRSRSRSRDRDRADQHRRYDSPSVRHRSLSRERREHGLQRNGGMSTTSQRAKPAEHEPSKHRHQQQRHSEDRIPRASVKAEAAEPAHARGQAATVEAASNMGAEGHSNAVDDGPDDSGSQRLLEETSRVVDRKHNDDAAAERDLRVDKAADDAADRSQQGASTGPVANDNQDPSPPTSSQSVGAAAGSTQDVPDVTGERHGSGADHHKHKEKRKHKKHKKHKDRDKERKKDRKDRHSRHRSVSSERPEDPEQQMQDQDDVKFGGDRFLQQDNGADYFDVEEQQPQYQQHQQLGGRFNSGSREAAGNGSSKAAEQREELEGRGGRRIAWPKAGAGGPLAGASRLFNKSLQGSLSDTVRREERKRRFGTNEGPVGGNARWGHDKYTSQGAQQGDEYQDARGYASKRRAH